VREKVNDDDDNYENFAGEIQLNLNKLTFGFSTLMHFFEEKISGCLCCYCFVWFNASNEE
jgi:hypothetical protein